MTYRAHVEAYFESAHKNGPPGHKCAGTLRDVPHDVEATVRSFFLDAKIPYADDLLDRLKGHFDYHGHSWLAEIEWEYSEQQLDENLWGPDFGKVKDLIRELDHHNLNLLFATPSAEFIASWLTHQFYDRFGMHPILVKLHEGKGNTMTHYGA